LFSSGPALMKVFNYVLKHQKNNKLNKIHTLQVLPNSTRTSTNQEEEEIFISCENYDDYERQEAKLSTNSTFVQDTRQCILCGFVGDYFIRSLFRFDA
jgi:translation elongation factor P/translation initiation factor 5A